MAEIGDTAETGEAGDCREEIPYDGVDQDCDGADLTDLDGDGWDALRVGGADCNDANDAVAPDADELCANLLDDDCDGTTDEGCEAQVTPDPGGISWICGLPGDVPGILPTLAALLILVGRRR